MAWIDSGIFTCIPGSIVANIPPITTQQLMIIEFPNVSLNLVSVFGYVLYTGNEDSPFAINTLLESRLVSYNAQLFKFQNSNLNGSFQFYRTVKAPGAVDVRFWLNDGT